VTADSLIQTLGWLLLLGSVLTAAKLYVFGLYRRYPILSIYFSLKVPQLIWPLLIDIRSPAYMQLWLITSPLFMVLYILLVFELYRLVLENYRGLHSILRWAMYVFGVVALVVSTLSLLPTIKPNASATQKTFRLFMAMERGVDTSLAIFIILLVLLLSRYPVKLSRNVRLYAIAFPLLFLGSSVGILIRTFNTKLLFTQANVVLQLVYTGSVFIWVLFLNRAGEEVPVTTRHFAPEQEKRLLTQLDALNATLLKVSRQ
jgi:hypothetical protein